MTKKKQLQVNKEYQKDCERLAEEVSDFMFLDIRDCASIMTEIRRLNTENENFKLRMRILREVIK